MSQVHSFVFSPFSENTYVIADETGEAVVVDPGCYEQAEKEELARFIDDNKLTVRKILLTHAHLDHVFGVAFVKRKYARPADPLQAWLHELDQPIYNDVPTRSQLFGLRGYEHSNIDHFLNSGDEVSFGTTRFEVRFVPGHAPGHVVFVNHADRYVIAGDTLFRGSIGRTDLPYGNHAELIRRIQNELFTLPDDYTVYPGHNDPTTIGHEKKTNPFFQ
jgi:hydroxyacylglutathione hydrolase